MTRRLGEVIAKAIEFCEAKRAFFLVDYEPTRDAATIADWVAGLGSQKNAAVYFPRVLVADPTESTGQTEIPVSGSIAGLFARTDQQRGVWKAPAGTDAGLRGITGPSLNLSDSENDVLNPLAINCLRTFPATGTVCWGARTLEGPILAPSGSTFPSGVWPYFLRNPSPAGHSGWYSNRMMSLCGHRSA